jgi:DNA-binding NarL/FixJ family response regulator
MTAETGDGRVRVIIADDHPVFREGLQTILADDDSLDVVAAVIDGAAAIAAVAESRPDVVLMDLQMPGIGGVEATAQISIRHPDVAVLVLTMSEDADSVFAALRAGARGYLLKEAAGADIVRAVHAVEQGEAVFGPRVADKVIAFFSAAQRLAGAVPFPQLTSREREVLDLAAQGRDNATIARRLFLSEKTVRNNMSACLHKLQAASRAEAVALARDAGLGAPPSLP